MLHCDTYLVPGSLAEAFDRIDEHTDRYKLVAGATDLIPQAREGRQGDHHVPALVDITRVPELQGIRLQDGRVRMGALTTFQDFLASPAISKCGRVLTHCSRLVADIQIRLQATIGGNIVNASPAADGTVALLPLEADVILVRREQGRLVERRLRLADFVLGPGLTQIRDGEILAAVEFPALPEDAGTGFHKVGRRRSLIISVVSVAAVVRLDASRRRFADVRLGLGAIGPVPVRAVDAETILNGAPVTPETIHRAAEAAAETWVRSRTRQSYRKVVTATFVARAIRDALAEIGCELEATDVG